MQRQLCCCGLMLGQTDGRTDGRTRYRFINPAAHTMRTVPTTIKHLHSVVGCKMAKRQPEKTNTELVECRRCFFPAEEGVAIVKSTNNHTTCNPSGRRRRSSRYRKPHADWERDVGANAAVACLGGICDVAVMCTGVMWSLTPSDLSFDANCFCT